MKDYLISLEIKKQKVIIDFQKMDNMCKNARYINIKAESKTIFSDLDNEQISSLVQL